MPVGTPVSRSIQTPILYNQLISIWNPLSNGLSARSRTANWNPHRSIVAAPAPIAATAIFDITQPYMSSFRPYQRGLVTRYDVTIQVAKNDSTTTNPINGFCVIQSSI